MSDAAGRTLLAGDGRRITLGKLIKSGGAGSVYRVPEIPASIAKLYHANQDFKVYERKIAAMLELRPQLPELQDGDTHIVQLAWPQASLFDERRRFVGYLMPTVDIEATSELECVLQERQARSLGLPTGLGAKVTLAANLCTVIGELHRQRHYIVDLKPVNLRFYRHSLYLALLDCDGFSIQGDGERFEALQITPDYLAPEFHAHALTGAGEAQQDRFALAVVVFQLLNFGIHPFTGRPQSDRVPTDIPGRIAGRWYAHGVRGNASLLPSPASGHAAMPSELRTLFDRAFEQPGSRPSADEWRDVLRGYAQRSAGKLRVCASNDAHQHFTGHECAACLREGHIALAHARAASAPPRQRARIAPYRPAKTAARLPPNVLARANQAWVKSPPSLHATPAPPPARKSHRPANWPPPVALSTSPPTTMGAAEKVVTTLVSVSLLVLFFAMARSCSGPAPDNGRLAASLARIAQAPQIQREQRRAAGSTRVAVSGPAPTSELASLMFAIAADVDASSPESLAQDLETLRARARETYAKWNRGAVEADPSMPPSLAGLSTNMQSQGWVALDAGDRDTALARFDAALAVDPDNADVWLGRAFSTRDGNEAVAMAAVAFLMYPDARSARSSVGGSMWRAANADRARHNELEYVLGQAAARAEALRTSMPPGSVRMSEPISWGGR